MPNPLTDELSAEAKAELAAMFAALKVEYPPVQFERLGGYIRTVPLFMSKPWQRRGW
jgi:hypothetical protein